MSNLLQKLLPEENFSTYISSLWIIQIINAIQIIIDIFACVYLFGKRQQSINTSIETVAETVAIIECVIVLLTIYNVAKLTTVKTDCDLPNHALYNMGLNICQSITNIIEIGLFLNIFDINFLFYLVLASFLVQLLSVLISYKFWYFLMYNYNYDQDNQKEMDRITLGSSDRLSKSNIETNLRISA